MSGDQPTPADEATLSRVRDVHADWTPDHGAKVGGLCGCAWCDMWRDIARALNPEVTR